MQVTQAPAVVVVRLARGPRRRAQQLARLAACTPRHHVVVRHRRGWADAVLVGLMSAACTSAPAAVLAAGDDGHGEEAAFFAVASALSGTGASWEWRG